MLIHCNQLLIKTCNCLYSFYELFLQHDYTLCRIDT